MPIEEAKREIYTRLGADPDAVVRLAWTSRRSAGSSPARAEVPGFGWAGFAPAPLAHPVDGRPRPTDSARADQRLVPVEVDRRPTAPSPSTAWPGYGRLVDGGDLGDTYNYSPPRE